MKPETHIQMPRTSPRPGPCPQGDREASAPRVFDFLDYRKYLKAFYEHAKRTSKGRFSYRVFSNQTGVDSPNYLKLIVDGQRNLTPAHAKRVAKFCRLVE